MFRERSLEPDYDDFEQKYEEDDNPEIDNKVDEMIMERLEREDKVYEEYCKRHPEEITSDFILEEDGNEDYIKEIREYIACPQLGDNHYGKWGTLSLDQRLKIKQLLDYITNLQEKYEEADKLYSKMIYKYNSVLLRIDKAIEYINTHEYPSPYGLRENDLSKRDLLNILQGEDKE